VLYSDSLGGGRAGAYILNYAIANVIMS